MTGTRVADLLDGLSGNDTYLFEGGFGQDFINDNDTTVGNQDVVRFLDRKLSDFVVTNDGRDIIFSDAASGDTVKVGYYLNGTSQHIEKVVFADGAELDEAGKRVVNG